MLGSRSTKSNQCEDSEVIDFFDAEIFWILDPGAAGLDRCWGELLRMYVCKCGGSG